MDSMHEDGLLSPLSMTHAPALMVPSTFGNTRLWQRASPGKRAVKTRTAPFGADRYDGAASKGHDTTAPASNREPPLSRTDSASSARPPAFRRGEQSRGSL